MLNNKEFEDVRYNFHALYSNFNNNVLTIILKQLNGERSYP